MIKNVVFDIGMVLVSFRWRELLDDLSITGEARKQITEQIFCRVWAELDGVNCDEAEFRRRCEQAVPDYSEEISQIIDHVSEISNPYPYACDWLSRIKDMGYNVYLLSNFGKFPFETLLSKYEFVKFADGRVVSYEIEEVKPEPAIYQYLLQKYGLVPQETVFIDDRQENIETAKRLGIHGILFTTYDETNTQLTKFLKNA
jgi:putative hydrolase of the HAD superfamily